MLKLTMISLAFAGASGLLLTRPAMLRTASRVGSSPSMMTELDFLGSQSSDDCIILPHPAYPGETPEIVFGECNLVVRTPASMSARAPRARCRFKPLVEARLCCRQLTVAAGPTA